MIDKTLTSVLEDQYAFGTGLGDLLTSTTSTPLIIKGDYSISSGTLASDIYQNATVTWGTPNSTYYSPPLYSYPYSSSLYYSPEELLSTIKSILDSYGFEFVYNPDDTVSNTSLSEKETSSDVLGWVAVGFLEKKSYLSNFQFWLRFATNSKLHPTSITLTVKEGSYFENFSIKILLENYLVLIDSTSGIIHIIQEMLLENLQKAFDEIIESLEPKTRGQGTTSLGYSNCVGISYDADTTISVNNYGVNY